MDVYRAWGSGVSGAAGVRWVGGGVRLPRDDLSLLLSALKARRKLRAYALSVSSRAAFGASRICRIPAFRGKTLSGLSLGSGTPCWRRLRDWQAASVWDEARWAALVRLRKYDQVDTGYRWGLGVREILDDEPVTCAPQFANNCREQWELLHSLSIVSVAVRD